MEITQLTIAELHKQYLAKKISVQEVTDAYLKNIHERNSSINAYLEIFPDIQDQVKTAQHMIDRNNVQPLTGVPIAIKDNMMRAGFSATAGSLILKDYHATYHAHVVDLLQQQGAIILGRTNMDEFAMGSSNETSAYGVTRNPLDEKRVPGGSSGGSAASVAMHGACVSLGSDTGGSIRQPASFCGLVGLKPTYGALSRRGLIAMASSLDIIGPLGKTVADVEVVYRALAVHDTQDSTSIPDTLRAKAVTKAPKIIGIPSDFLTMPGVADDVLENYHAHLDTLRSLGYTLKEVNMPLMKYSLAVYYILQPAEASSNLARYDGVRYGLSVVGNDIHESYKNTRSQGLGTEVKRRILLGTYILSHGYYDAYYNKARAVQSAIRHEFEQIFQEVDLLVTPTTPNTAFEFGAKSSNPLEMYMSDMFVVPANIAGIPAITIPSGLGKDKMPLGLHFMAPYLGEDMLFQIGKVFEQAQKTS